MDGIGNRWDDSKNLTRNPKILKPNLNRNSNSCSIGTVQNIYSETELDPNK